jgi:20S proteasome subunit beta 5
MNGKRWPWEAVVLLPFIDSRRLIDAARKLVPDDKLSDEERQRNTNGNAWVIASEDKVTKRVPLESTRWDYQPEESAVMRPELAPGVRHPQPGFPTLKEAPIQSLMLRNVGINVFGIRSRYRTALLVLGEVLPTTPPVETLGKKLIGTTIFINYPFLTEAFVTAVSNSECTMRGTAADNLRRWKPDESLVYKQKSLIMKKNQAFGEKLTGSGGWMMPDSDIMVSVRPLEGLKTIPNGSKARVFAKFEVDLPLTAAVWVPSYEDSRLTNTPVLLEREPYFVAWKQNTRKDVGAPSMLPEYEEPETKKSQPLGPILPHVPENDPYAPPVILPSFEEQDPPVMHPPYQDTSNHELLKPRTSPSLLPPSHYDIASVASRGFATNPSRIKRTQKTGVQGRRSYTTTSRRLTSPRAVVGSPRGRLLALGGAASAAAMMFNSGGALALHRTPWSCRSGAASVQSSGLSGVFEIRAGGQDILEGNTDVGSLIEDVAPPKLEFAHGTTTLSFIFDGGIVAAVDSRASLGNFVGSKTTQKVLPVNTHMLGTMAGGAADCSYWIRALRVQAQLYELTEGRRMSVVRASRLLSNALYANRASDLSVGTMIMGFDPDGPQIYYVDNTGVRINGDLFAVGSSSTFTLGILDTERRKDMTEDEAVALGIKAIRHATFRDAFSGGFIGVYVINKDGWRKVFSEDVARSPRDVWKEEESD